MCSTPTSCNSTASHVSLDVDAPTISHLQLADGTLFFCLVEEDQIEKQKAILFCYEAVSGLKLNFFKNELIGIEVDEHLVDYLANIMGCKVRSPTSYFWHAFCV